MKNCYLFLLPLIVLLSCNRPDDEMVTPTKPIDKEPPITEVRQAFDSLYLGFQYITARTATMDVRFSCELEISNYKFKRESIREVGFCLSATDSVLSITNPQHIRLKAATVTNTSQFTATTATLLPNQFYYIEPYFMTTDGRVYYGRYLPTFRLQTPSWQPRPAFNAVTRFKINQFAKSEYSSVRVVARASVPFSDFSYHPYSFVADDKLYALSSDGNLAQYDADQDKWASRKKLVIEPGGYFNGFPAVVFGLNNRGYALYTDALVPNPTNYWEYNPQLDQWVKLDGASKPNIASYQYTYQAGNQAVLTDEYGKKAGYFSGVQKDIQPVARPNLLTYLSAGAKIVPVGNQPYAIYTDYDTRQLAVDVYNTDSDAFTDIGTVSAAPVDRGPALRFAQNGDLMLGFGSTSDLLGDSRIITYLTQYSDDLIRYSPKSKQVTARYAVDAIRSEYGYNYPAFTIGGRTYVITATTGKLWELQF